MKINVKLTLAFLIMCLVPLIIAAVLIHHNSTKSLSQQAINNLESIASWQHTRIQALVDHYLETLSLVTDKTALQMSLQNYLKENNPADLEELNRTLQDIDIALVSFSDVDVLTLDGMVLASTITVSTDVIQLDGRHPIERYEEDDIDLLLPDTNGNPVIQLSGPLYWQDELLGCVIIRTGADELMSMVGDYTGLGNTGETLLAKRDEIGNTVYISPLRFDPGATLTRSVSKDAVQLSVNQALLGNEQVFTDSIDYRGEPVLAVTRYIDEADWGLVVKMDTAEAFAPVYSLRNSLLLTVLIAVLFIAFLSIYVSRRITKPMVDLTYTAVEISTGNLSRRATVESDDEVGILAQAFNQMTDSLADANTELEKKVDDRTVELAMEIIGHQRAEDELKESEQKYRSLVDNIHAGVFRSTADIKGRFLEVNPAMEEITGYSREELLHMDVADLYVHSEERAALLQEIGLSDSISTRELQFRKKDGSEITVSDIKVPIRNNTGHIMYYDGILEDITERKKAEEERHKVARLESLGTLAGGIAHDFNNFLTGIMGYIKLVSRSLGTGDNEKALNRIGEAEKVTLRAQDLTQQLLTFARGGTRARKVISIAELIKESAMFAMRGASVSCDFSLADDLWMVEVDEGQINQVITNLIINAQEAMMNGGKIRIEARNRVINAGEILPLNEGNYVEITVSDNGSGISEENITQVFDPYFSTKPEGSGLGLATSYSVIKNHEGHISVTSKLGVGTAFCIYLPASITGSPRKEPEMLASPSLSSVRRVLVMDNEKANRDVVYHDLTDVGYEVELTEDGHRAIEQYIKARQSGRPFDAVVLDLPVPEGVRGKDVADKLLEIDPGAKVIITSGYSHDLVVNNNKEHGFSAVITKPYKTSELERILNSAIEER